MTASVDVQASGLRSGRRALPRLVAGDLDEFADAVWGRCAMLSRAGDLPGGFSDLFSADAVDELIAERGLRTPFMRVAKEGTTLGDSAFTSGGGVGAGIADQLSDDKLTRLFADGSTLVLQALHRTWAPLTHFAQDLAADLAHPVQVNAYVTPPQSRGFDDHYDVHDVFVLQIDGEKQWRIHAPVHPAPLRDQPWTDRREAVARAAQTEPLIDTTLSPGDCLYLPRGYLHAATALGGVSTHLTIGVHTWTRHNLAEQLVAEALRGLALDPESRASLGLGVAVEDAEATRADLELVREHLVAALAQADPAAIADRMADQVRAAGRAAPLGPLAQHRATGSLTDDDVVRLRDHLAPTLRPSPDGSASLRTRAGDERIAANELEAVRALLAGDPLAVSAVGPALARRLLSAGILVLGGP